jgi:16S rRNA (uracil1498-N3)-methyltransferase
MSHRFYVDVPVTADTAVLTGSEARHACKVMRLQPLDELTLFDGSGREFGARVCSIDKEVVTCDVITRNDVDRELATELIVAAALPKGDRQKWLIQKAVELGVRRFVPLITDRGVAQPEHKAVQRLRRVVIEASKQCGRNVLMEVSEATPLTSVALSESTQRVLAHPPTGTPCRTIRLSRSVCVAVGPEGGFTEAELVLASQTGWQQVSLGPRVLRVETAALALAAWIALDG